MVATAPADGVILVFGVPKLLVVRLRDVRGGFSGASNLDKVLSISSNSSFTCLGIDFFTGFIVGFRSVGLDLAYMNGFLCTTSTELLDVRLSILLLLSETEDSYVSEKLIETLARDELIEGISVLSLSYFSRNGVVCSGV